MSKGGWRTRACLLVAALVGMSVFVTSPAKAERLKYLSTKVIGINDYSMAQGNIAADSSGNVYVAGYLGGDTPIDLDPSSGTDIRTPGNINGIFISKYHEGSYLWSRTIGSALLAVASFDVKTDVDGNVYVFGYFQGTGDFDPGEGTDEHSSFDEDEDVFITKFNADGSYGWTATIPLEGSEQTVAGLVSPDGMITVIGETRNFSLPEPGAAFVSVTFIARFDSSGTYLGGDTITGAWATELGAGPDNTIWIGGFFSGTVDFDPTAGVDQHTSAPEHVGAFLSRYDSTYKYLGTVIAETEETFGIPTTIQTDAAGDVLVAGGGVVLAANSASTPTVSVPRSFRPEQIVITKFKADGSMLWSTAKPFGGETYVSPMAVSAGGASYIDSYGQAAAEDGEEEEDQRGRTLTTGFSASGEEFQSAEWTARALRAPLGMAFDSRGHLFVYGIFQDTVDFDPSPGEDIISVNEVGGAFITEYEILYDVTGTVRARNSNPLAGVTVSLSGTETRTTTTDAEGRFSFLGLRANSSYTVSVAKEGAIFCQDAQSGILNQDKALSFFSDTACPVFGLWNTNLGMTNILEVENTGAEEATVVLSAWGGGGASEEITLSEAQVVLPAYSKKDILLAGLGVFARNRFGTLKVTPNTTKVIGRMSYYSAAAGGEFQFASSIPLSPRMWGASAVLTNNIQPSRSPAEAGNPIPNWLSILNPDAAAKSFAVKLYNIDGSLVRTWNETVPGYGRVDRDPLLGGLGLNSVGVIEVAPDDTTTPYAAVLIRYGALENAGEQYNFAFPVQPVTETPAVQYLPVSSIPASADYLELANGGGSSVTVQLTWYDLFGVETASSSKILAAHSQTHIDAGALLPASSSGTLKVESPEGSLILAGIGSYHFSSDGSLLSAYYSSKAEVSPTLTGSYNTFLGAFNWLRLLNTSASATVATVTLARGTPGEQTQSLSIPARGRLDFELANSGLFTIASETYGPVSVSATAPVAAEVLRVKPTSTMALDFVNNVPLN